MTSLIAEEELEQSSGSESNDLFKRSFSTFSSPPAKSGGGSGRATKKRITTPNLIALQAEVKGDDDNTGRRFQNRNFVWQCILSHVPEPIETYDEFDSSGCEQNRFLSNLPSINQPQQPGHYVSDDCALYFVQKSETEASREKISRIARHAQILCEFLYVSEDEQMRGKNADDYDGALSDGLAEYYVAHACDWLAQLEFLARAPPSAMLCCGCDEMLQFLFACVCLNFVCKAFHEDNDCGTALQYDSFAQLALCYSLKGSGVAANYARSLTAREKTLRLRITDLMIRIEQKLMSAIDYRLDAIDDFDIAVHRIVFLCVEKMKSETDGRLAQQIYQLISKRRGFHALIGVCIYDMYTEFGDELALHTSTWMRTNLALSILYYQYATLDQIWRPYEPICGDWSGKHSMQDFFAITRGDCTKSNISASSSNIAYEKLKEQYIL